jgi:hypothetical protein
VSSASATNHGFKAALTAIRTIEPVETFVIRVWVPAACQEDSEQFLLRGLVEHIASGRKDAFLGGSELLAFVEANLDARRLEAER